MGTDSDEERRRKVRRIIAQRRVLRIFAWGLLATSLLFLFRQSYAIAIPMAAGAVALAILSDWIVKPPQEL